MFTFIFLQPLNGSNSSVKRKIDSPGGVLVFLKFTQNSTERQVLWSLCSVDFHTLTLQLPIQTPHSVASELPSFCEFTGKLCKFQENEHTPESVRVSNIIWEAL